MRPFVTASAALGAAWALPAPAVHSAPLARLFGLPLDRPGLGAVALTFDDGPHACATPRVLSILAEHGATATFFVVGEQVRRTGSLLSEIRAAGHSVALHGDTHPNALRLTPVQLLDDVRRGQEAVSAAIGEAPQLYRPPYGTLSVPGLLAVRRAGFEIQLWNRWGRDWQRSARPQSVTARVLAPGPWRAGDVVLLHDADDYGSQGSWLATTGALPSILGSIMDARLRALRIS